ncbi:WecB/TagA/CpsF family glycosyltransferase [Pullulanibacillus sp. KACC 23026]|uniref:WecB/TagA/CpsF family glycosyltransferase n=1 Tax=Pullulanibacillus sp. KACC 23026 TaxID=3028315 RepID=UPI0023AFE09A|nr:WecB/TagA/CpsF family glycosyltransferase [Pullulanibacillus sp. KACC 23026]WEG13588.1 WecB/TagA/CpsF family glycosyltransferase [Pullulanibacillus sp. KACC 23026]
MTTGKVLVLGVPFNNLTMEQLLQKLEEHLENQDKIFMATSNPEIVMYAEKDPEYRKILTEADYNIPDGIGIVKAAKLLNLPIEERVTGFDTVMHLLEVADRKRLKLYFLGSTEDVLQKAVERTKANYPHIDLVGARNGFFDWHDPSIAEDIQAKKPDIILVGMGFPRQEKWIYEHLPSFEKGLFIGVGGTIDILAGEVKRAPAMWQKYNVEWLYRLLSDPTRFKRMMVLPVFMMKIYAKRLTTKH